MPIRPMYRQLAVVEVEPAEAQPVLGGVELGDLLRVHGAECLALGPGLMRPAGLPQHLRQPVRGATPQVIKPAVEQEMYSCSPPISSVDNHAPFPVNFVLDLEVVN